MSELGDVVVAEQGALQLLLNTKKSAGPDNIPNEFVKRCAEWIAKFLVLRREQ